MTFALTRFKSYGRRHEGATRSHEEQVCELHITAANTDTALDLDNGAGTFWVAALANATYGALATKAKSVFLTDIVAVKHRCLTIDSEDLNASYLRAITGPAANNYTVTIGGTTAHMPALTFHSGDAPTAYTLFITWSLVDGAESVTSDLGAAVTN